MKEFNIIVSGYGGQGVLSLTKIIAKAALKQGYQVKQAELHGLAQRGGALQCHVRFGKEINSPLVRKANLIISLEAVEALRACSFADKNTSIITNAKVFRFKDSLNSIFNKIKKYTKKLHIVDADKIVKELTGDIIDVNTFILGYSLKKKLLPLKKELVWKALEEKINKRFLKQNKKVFDASFK